MVLGSVKDEKTFFTMKFMKSKFYNCLTIRPSGQNVCVKLLQAKMFSPFRLQFGSGGRKMEINRSKVYRNMVVVVVWFALFIF